MNALLFLVVMAGQGFGASDESVADLCHNGHVHARESIRTIACTVELAYARPLRDGGAVVNRVSRIEWKQDGEAVRAHVHFGNGMSRDSYDAVWKDGHLKQLKYLPGAPHPEQRQSAQLSGPQAVLALPNPWQYALFGWQRPMPVKLEPPFLKSATPVQTAGGKLYRCVIQSTDEPAETEYYFDPRHNFLVSKIVAYGNREDKSVFATRSVTKFAEPKPGIFFPAAVEEKTTKNGVEDVTSRVAFKDLKINDPIDPTTFVMTIPDGTYVSDVVEGVSYTAGQNEKPATTPKPIVPPQPVGNATGVGPAAPKSYPIAWACGAIAAAVGGLWLLFRVRRSDSA